MPVQIRKIVNWFEEWAPASLALPEDPIGLQLGTMDQAVATIAIALDVTESVVEEAIKRGAKLIIAHHPLIYRPLHSIRTDHPDGRVITRLLSHQISVFIAHTNLDVAVGGVNDMLAELFGLGNISIFKQTYPDEKVAYDLFRLEQGGTHYGLGRIGTLAQPMTLQLFSNKIKQSLGISNLRIVGEPERLVTKVAVLGGSGKSYLKHAINVGVDVYITGDVDHHTAHDALAANLALIDPGHHMEHILKLKLAKLLNNWLQQQDVEVNVYASEISTDPFQWI